MVHRVAMLSFTPPHVSTGAQFRPDDFTQAYARGENASRSFVDTWDFWPVLDHQVDDLRREYQIYRYTCYFGDRSLEGP